MYYLVRFADGWRCVHECGVAESLAFLLKCWPGNQQMACVSESPDWVPPKGTIDSPYDHLAAFCITNAIPLKA
jgi:hypothetical protein